MPVPVPEGTATRQTRDRGARVLPLTGMCRVWTRSPRQTGLSIRVRLPIPRSHPHADHAARGPQSNASAVLTCRGMGFLLGGD